MTVERITKKQALRAARARLPILGERKLQEQLEFAAGSLAEAYLLGVQEAQHCIAVRIEAIRARSPQGSAPSPDDRDSSAGS